MYVLHHSLLSCRMVTESFRESSGRVRVAKHIDDRTEGIHEGEKCEGE